MTGAGSNTEPEPDYPWNDWNAVLRHTDNNKWYGVIIEVDRSKLGMDGTGVVDVLNVKCDPTIIGMLRMQPGFYPAYHMNKENGFRYCCAGRRLMMRSKN